MRARLAAVALCVALAACSGHSSPPHRSSSAPNPISVPPVSTSGSSVSIAPTSCAAGAVTAPGAPFCYPLPNGFADNSSATDYASGWQWRTLVSIGPHDLVQVIGHPVQADLDTLPPADALNFVETLMVREDTPGVGTATVLTNTTVDGARAFRQDAHYQIGVDAENYTVLRGHSVVSISCQNTPSGAARVSAACAEILATIAIDDR